MIEDLTPQTASKILPALRKKYDVSLGYVADKLGMSPSTVYSWESGTRKPIQPTVDRLKQIFNGFRIAQEKREKI